MSTNKGKRHGRRLSRRLRCRRIFLASSKRNSRTLESSRAEKEEEEEEEEDDAARN